MTQEEINLFAADSFDRKLRGKLSDLQSKADQGSLRSLAKEAGVSVGALSMYVTGRTKLSEKIYFKIRPHLKAGKDELRLLDLLRRWSSGSSPEEKLSALKSLCRMKAFKNFFVRDIESSKYLTSWLNIVIRELASVSGFRADPDWIQSRIIFDVSTTEIRSSLRFLIDNGFLEKDANGSVRPTNKDIICNDKLFLFSMGIYHKQMLELAKKSIQRVPSKSRQVKGLTLALSADQFIAAKKILDEALDQIHRLSNADSLNGEVYQIESSLFPLTQKQKSESEVSCEN